MLVALHRVKRHAQCYTWSEALCLILYKGVRYMFITIHGVKL